MRAAQLPGYDSAANSDTPKIHMKLVHEMGIACGGPAPVAPKITADDFHKAFNEAQDAAKDLEKKLYVVQTMIANVNLNQPHIPDEVIKCTGWRFMNRMLLDMMCDCMSEWRKRL